MRQPGTGTKDRSEFIYAEGHVPFTVELNTKEGDDSLAAQEIAEFLEALQGMMKKSCKRDRVIEHLQQTRFVVACRIPTDAGFHAVDVFLAYFLVHAGGMVQADGQDFYEMGKSIVELE